MKFWDSSAVVPLVVAEDGSEASIAEFREGGGVLVWALTPVEIVSALRRKARSGALHDRQLRDALARLQGLRDHWAEVHDLDVVRQRAERILAVHPLRAADSLQLAAALVAAEERPRGVPFVSFHGALRDAAAREGFDVRPPVPDD